MDDNKKRTYDSDTNEVMQSRKKSKKEKKVKKSQKKKDKKEKKHSKSEKHKHSKKKKKSDSSSSSSSSDSESDSAPRSIITGKKIKMTREVSISDQLLEIERAAKRHYMNSQF